MRDDEGYSSTYYDAEDMDENYYYYYMTVPENDGSLYFTAETYY